LFPPWKLGDGSFPSLCAVTNQQFPFESLHPTVPHIIARLASPKKDTVRWI
jgi:hypothetical protein